MDAKESSLIPQLVTPNSSFAKTANWTGVNVLLVTLVMCLLIPQVLLFVLPLIVMTLIVTPYVMQVVMSLKSPLML